MEIGFIGLGNMGEGMAANILAAGHRLTVNDIRSETAGPLLEKGATWAETPKAIAAASEIVFTSLPGPEEVASVATGADGIIEAIQKYAVVSLPQSCGRIK